MDHCEILMNLLLVVIYLFLEWPPKTPQPALPRPSPTPPRWSYRYSVSCGPEAPAAAPSLSWAWFIMGAGLGCLAVLLFTQENA